MAQFQLGVRTSNVTTNNAICEIIAGPLKPCWLKILQATLATAVTGVFGLGRPAAAGITPTSPAQFLSEMGVGAGSEARLALAWGTSPTVPAAFFNRMSAPATIGAIRDVVLTSAWAQSGHGGICVPAGSTLVLFNITGGPTLDLSLSIDE